MPVQHAVDDRTVTSVGLLGSDLPGLRPHFEVEEGDLVEKGQVLFTDRKDPRVAFVSPLAGRVTGISFGARKTLSSCIVTATEDASPDHATSPIEATDHQSIRDVLRSRGMWSAFRTRPFGRIPDADAKTLAIFVNACQASMRAPDPSVVLQGREDLFRLGISHLKQMTEGKVFVCQSPGEALCAQDDRVEVVSFGGTLAAGLSGTHIDCLYPIRAGIEVWTIGYQDVIAIGHLFATGQYLGERFFSVSGGGSAPARIVRSCLGAKISDICSEQESPCALAGDTLTGHPATYLGRFDLQISVGSNVIATTSVERRSHGSGPSALIATRALDNALAPDILPVPLLRALSIGDSETAKRLGCLALVEEDVAALSRVCTSGAPYEALLRLVLNELMAETA